jgi:hypothetical protein
VYIHKGDTTPVRFDTVEQAQADIERCVHTPYVLYPSRYCRDERCQGFHIRARRFCPHRKDTSCLTPVRTK